MSQMMPGHDYKAAGWLEEGLLESEALAISLRWRIADLESQVELLRRMVSDLQQESAAFERGREAERRRVVEFLDGMARGPAGTRSLALDDAMRSIRDRHHVEEGGG